MDAETIVTIVVLGFVVIILALGLWALWASNTDSSTKYSNGQGFDEQIVRRKMFLNVILDRDELGKALIQHYLE